MRGPSKKLWMGGVRAGWSYQRINTPSKPGSTAVPSGTRLASTQSHSPERPIASENTGSSYSTTFRPAFPCGLYGPVDAAWSPLRCRRCLSRAAPWPAVRSAVDSSTIDSASSGAAGRHPPGTGGGQWKSSSSSGRVFQTISPMGFVRKPMSTPAGRLSRAMEAS